MRNHPVLSVVIPIYNEELVIPTLFERCMKSISDITSDFEIIAVNDGSSDSSLRILKECHGKDPRFKVLSLSRNFGHQSAFFAGLNYAKGEVIAMIDGDLQDPPELLHKFYDKIKEGFDVVYAIRKKRKEGLFKKFAYWLYYRVLDKVAEIPIPHDSGDFSMFTRRALLRIIESQESSLFIRGIRSWIGFKQIGIEYDRDKRFSGEPKYSIKNLFKLAYNGLYSFSKFPIKFLTTLGGIVVFVSILYSLYTLYVHIFKESTPQGFTTLAIAIFLFSGIQLLGMGIIGEYVLRIYDESRDRPLYIVDSFLEKQNTKVTQNSNNSNE